MSQTKSQLLNPLNGNINVTGIITSSASVVGTSVTINNGGIDMTGVVTATSFIGDGSGLSNLISGVGIQSGSNRVGTGFTDLNIVGTGVTVVGSGTTVTITLPSQLNGFLNVNTRVGVVTVIAYSGILTVFGRTSDTNIFV
jgi:hypothetical protein